MSLAKYRKKRNFDATPEPYGRVTKHKQKLLYLIQKHAASHLHYDFRLELDGTLKSWAIPKGPSLDPSVKRLAVQVEDHPLEYGHFEGIIPQGQYGGGTVMLWDTGEWECLEEDANKAYQAGALTFILKGKKLKGEWKLVQIKNDAKNWLLIKAKDRYIKSSTEYDITAEKPNSALTRRSMRSIEEQASDDTIWHSKSKAKRKVKKKRMG